MITGRPARPRDAGTARRACRSSPPTSADKQSNLLRFQDVDLLCPTEREVRETLHDFSSGLGAVVWNLLNATRRTAGDHHAGQAGAGHLRPRRGRRGRRPASQRIPARPAGRSASTRSAAATPCSPPRALRSPRADRSRPPRYSARSPRRSEVQMLGISPLTIDRLTCGPAGGD